jgi:ElaA protein
MIWNWLHFAELAAKQIYDVLQLREAVFQLEQSSLYKDIDGIDLHAKHLLGYSDEQLLAYLRIHLKDDVIYISRVLVSKASRGKSLGSVMLTNTLSHLQENYPKCAIVSSVQKDKIGFYSKFGFVVVGQVYVDAGVPHVSMQYDSR